MIGDPTLHPIIEQFWLTKADYIQQYGLRHLEWFAYRNNPYTSENQKMHPYNVVDIVGQVANYNIENGMIYFFDGKSYYEQEMIKVIKMVAFV